MIKCDEPMRRSKEQCYIREGVKWTCDLRCDECHCALHKKPDGTWEHAPVRLGHSHGGKDES